MTRSGDAPALVAVTDDFARFDADERAERRRLKDLARSDESRVLDPWERYRALSDHCDSVLDLTELYDRKTRFALLILGGLNAINVLLVAKADLVAKSDRSVIGAYALCYALLSLYFFSYAISALKPRQAPTRRAGDHPAEAVTGLRLADALPQPSLDEYCDHWREARVGQLNRELATIAYRRTATNGVKRRNVQRLYHGLYVLVALTAVLICIMGYQSMKRAL